MNDDLDVAMYVGMFGLGCICTGGLALVGWYLGIPAYAVGLGGVVVGTCAGVLVLTVPTEDG